MTAKRKIFENVKFFLGFTLLWVIFIPEFSGQLINNDKCKAFTDESFFSQQFIKNNKIKSITGTIATKEVLEVIRQKNLVIHYDFSLDGMLAKQYETINKSNGKDTLFTTYTYDENGWLIAKRTSDSYGFFSNNFTYNKDGIKTSKKYCRDENAHGNRNEFELARQYIITEEAFNVQQKDTLIIINVLNNNGRSYQEELYYYNQLGLLVKEEKKLLVNHKKSMTSYTYSDLGHVTEKKYFQDANKSDYLKTVYQYDEVGNLTYIDDYRNEDHILHKELLYEQSTMLLTALLIQDVSLNFITITKYKYEFYAGEDYATGSN